MDTYEKKIREYLNNSEVDELYKNMLLNLFPELRESEDEKVRKALAEMVHDTTGDELWVDYNVHKEEALAWLEKQGEKKLTDKIEPKFKIGDWCIDNEDGVMFKIVEVLDNTYIYKTTEGKEYSCTHYSLENDAKLWTIQDAKDGDVLFQDLMCGKTFIYNGVNPDMAILYSFIISNDGKDVLPYHIGKPNTGIGNIEENKNIIHPATQKQRDLLFQKMHEASYEWDAEKKELKKIEKDPTWSEENEDMIQALNVCIDAAIKSGMNYISFDSKSILIEKVKNWLKSLKNRVQPKIEVE